MSEMMWVTIPGGTIRRGEEREMTLRVLIAPKLESETLAAAGMERWPPQSLVNARLAVEFAEDVAGELHMLEIEPPHIRAQPGVWEAFFGPNTIVTPRRPRDRAAPQVEVDSTSSKAAAITETFTRAASTELRSDHDDRPALNAAVRTELLSRWSGEESPPPQVITLPAPDFQPPDFHRTISMLREHPTVLRALGLIIELRLPISALPTRFSEGIVRVRWPGAPASISKIVTPWTRYDNRFLPGSTTNISAGMVTLTDDREGAAVGDPRWEIVTVDVDNGAKRLLDAAKAIAAAPVSATATSGAAITFMLPAMRSAGLMLVRRGRQADFEARRVAADNNARRDSMSEAVLTADDLVLGYRIDVKLQGRDWFSLHERDAKYTVSKGGAEITIGEGAVREEGHVKAHAAIDDGSGALRADEVVARWSGWSLSAPLPSFDATAGRRRPEPHPDMPFKFDWTFAVPKGTLPRLRFAHTYRMRARVADMAGGGLDVGDPAADRCFTAPVPYRRYEPVASPDIALPQGLTAEALGPGESIERVVIRSDFDADSADFGSNVRILLAPQTSLTLAEQHGALDDMTPEQIRELMKRARENARRRGTPFADEALFPDFAAGGVCVFPRREPGGLNVNRTERAWSETWPDFKFKQIVLRERVAGDSSILEWEVASNISDPSIGDRLIIRLAKAEELTLELSSFLKADFLDHFAINVNSLPAVSGAAASEGRHPMVTPERAVTLVHAVRRPLSDPRGTLKVRRNQGETFALLDPDPALLGIDPKSTAKVEIAATWTERSDDATREVANAPVQTVIVDRGDQFLKDQIRHEFGDTRRRKITYTLTAVSRFRQFFDTSEDNEAFVVRRALPEPVNIPNSARPSPPIVVSTRPAFVWQENRENLPDFTLIRRRLGGYLRLELKGPWYETGEGEQLAVLVWKDDRPPEDIWPFITQAGLDPVRHTGFPIRFPTSAAFTGAGAPREALLKEAGQRVVAVPYEPWFHDGRWFADIALPGLVTSADSSYCPFVQLAVARYQPDSLTDLEISPAVKTEMIQFMPERTLSVRRSGNDVFVSFHGQLMTGLPSQNVFLVFLERLQSPPGVSADTIHLTALEPPTDGIPAWVPIANQTGLGRVDGTGSPQEVKLQIQPDLGPFRIRVREYEPLTGPEEFISVGDDLTARTVYSDVVVLPET